MLGLAIGWCTFGLAALRRDRRHGVWEVGYLEAIFGGCLGLGAAFVAVCIALLVVMALARRVLGWWWFLPASVVLTPIPVLLVFVGPAHPRTRPTGSELQATGTQPQRARPGR